MSRLVPLLLWWELERGEVFLHLIAHRLSTQQPLHTLRQIFI